MAGTPATERQALDSYSATVVAVAERVLPAVASLRVHRAGTRDGGAGSGVVITPDGFIVTSAHVVAQSRTATAGFIDGSEYELDVVGADALSDLAIGRARAASLRPIEVGDADALRVGQLVVAIGNPMGFSGSVTSGVVSGLGRSLATADGNGHRRFVEDVIQTDAALMRNGRVRRAFIGIAGGTRALSPSVAQRTGFKAGVEVQEVVSDSPAAAARLRSGDLIVEVDGSPVSKAGDLQRLMVETRIGSKLSVRIVRGDRLVALEVVPAELK